MQLVAARLAALASRAASLTTIQGNEGAVLCRLAVLRRQHMGFSRFDSAALVVAHPDDEALWFSSVLGKVSRVIIAYEECDDLPGLGQSRRRASNDYPLSSAVFLRRPEPCSLSHVDWSQPEPTQYGMALNKAQSSSADMRYRGAYDALLRELPSVLRGVTDVFTHNPWGEYGHPDHVQVSRLVSTLGAELGFRTHFSSYVSPRSMRFASKFAGALQTAMQLKTDPALADQIKQVYLNHGCWTWHTAYVPPEQEAFLTAAERPLTEADFLPLTCLMTA